MGVAKPQKQSLIDILGTGYRTLTERLWLLLIPIALDLLLWLTPRLSMAPLLEPLRANLNAVADIATRSAEDQAQLLETMINADLRQVLVLLNFVPLYAPEVTNAASDRSLITLTEPLTIGVVAVGLNLVALLISAGFLGVLAAEVRAPGLHRRPPLAALLNTAFGIVGYVLTMLALVLILGVPFAYGTSVASQSLPGLLPLMIVIGGIVWFWVAIYTGFTIEAIALYRKGTLSGLIHSVQLVQHNFWSAFGLLVITAVITAGMSVIWLALAQSVAGILVAILGSAYVGTGLAAARMVFVADRSAISL